MNHVVFKLCCDQIYIVTQHVVTRHIIQINNLIIEEFIQKNKEGKKKKSIQYFGSQMNGKIFFFFFRSKSIFIYRSKNSFLFCLVVLKFTWHEPIKLVSKDSFYVDKNKIVILDQIGVRTSEEQKKKKKMDQIHLRKVVLGILLIDSFAALL